jgi:hypothetical protein
MCVRARHSLSVSIFSAEIFLSPLCCASSHRRVEGNLSTAINFPNRSPSSISHTHTHSARALSPPRLAARRRNKFSLFTLVLSRGKPSRARKQKPAKGRRKRFSLILGLLSPPPWRPEEFHMWFRGDSRRRESHVLGQYYDKSSSRELSSAKRYPKVVTGRAVSGCFAP